MCYLFFRFRFIFHARLVVEFGWPKNKHNHHDFGLWNGQIAGHQGSPGLPSVFDSVHHVRYVSTQSFCGRGVSSLSGGVKLCYVQRKSVCRSGSTMDNVHDSALISHQNNLLWQHARCHALHCNESGSRPFHHDYEITGEDVLRLTVSYSSACPQICRGTSPLDHLEFRGLRLPQKSTNSHLKNVSMRETSNWIGWSRWFCARWALRKSHFVSYSLPYAWRRVKSTIWSSWLWRCRRERVSLTIASRHLCTCMHRESESNRTLK